MLLNRRSKQGVVNKLQFNANKGWFTDLLSQGRYITETIAVDFKIARQPFPIHSRSDEDLRKSERPFPCSDD